MQDQITVLQLWSADSKERQAGWLRTMRSRIGALQEQPGFIALTTLESVDGGFVALRPLWRCLADAECAVNSAEAKAAREELLVWGSALGANFRVVTVFERRTRDAGALSRINGSARPVFVRLSAQIDASGQRRFRWNSCPLFNSWRKSTNAMPIR